MATTLAVSAILQQDRNWYPTGSKGYPGGRRSWRAGCRSERVGLRRIEQFAAYQLSEEFKLAVYALVDSHPRAARDFKYRDQLFESASGPPHHLTEGFNRRSTKTLRAISATHCRRCQKRSGCTTACIAATSNRRSARKRTRSANAPSLQSQPGIEASDHSCRSGTDRVLPHGGPTVSFSMVN